jgi:excinuclease ABC subunit C
MSNFDYKQALQGIPHKPGVYQYWDEDGKLLYIGKAKDLRNRVSSYFVNTQQQGGKTRVLVRKIRKITFTLVDTEIDAWLLENSLIKKHQPRYNVMLKDDKTYPWIVIKNEPFPRVYPTRNYKKDGSKYFGPYASVGMMHVVMDTIRELFPLRTCTLNLAPHAIQQGKYKVCLEYQIGNCKGPCEGLESADEYERRLEDIRDILNGKIQKVVRKLQEQMNLAAAQLQFEQAHQLKNKLDLLSKYQSKSTVVNSSIAHVDVFSIATEAPYAFVNYLKIMNGVIIQTQTLELKQQLEETEEDLLVMAILEIRKRYGSTAKEVVVPFPIGYEEAGVKYTVPRTGEKKKLLDLSLKNVAYFRKERLNQFEKLHPERRTERILERMKQDLRLKEWPRHIECFDNSNIQGNYPVSAIVVFRDAKPSKKDYRHFHVKTVEGPNDFATMEEAVYRRYRRMLDEQQPLPQLIVIDGGKGQLGAAMHSLRQLGIADQVTVLGIAKRLEELFFPGDPYPLHLDKKSETLKIIQQLRDEAHRFGITFHRNHRSKMTFRSSLEQIPGVGKTTTEKLLKRFKSVKKIKEASDEELREVLNAKQLLALREAMKD